MDNGTKSRISKDSQKIFEVTSSTNPGYKRRWKKACLAQHCKSVYGISLSDWMSVYRGRYKAWVITPYNPEKN